MLRRSVLLVLFASLLLGSAGTTDAATFQYGVANPDNTYDWNNSANWNSSPNNTTDIIPNGRTATLTTTSLYTPTYLLIGYYVDASADAGTLDLSGGTLRLGGGSATQLKVGWNSGNTYRGAFNLSNHSSFTAPSIANFPDNYMDAIGNGGGTGALSIDNSSFVTNHILFAGAGGGTGTINIQNGGTLTVGITNTRNLYLGGAKSGSFTAGNATLNINSGVSPDLGTANQLSVTGSLYVGCKGTATLTQDGGNVSAANVYIGGYKDSSYTFGGNGVYTMNAGTITVAAGGTLGLASTTASGSFNLNGGTVNMAGGTVATLTSFNFAGGLLNSATTIASDISLGASPVFQQDAGTTGAVTGALSDVSGVAGTLTKTGGGTLVLSGANTYSGKTTVQSGSLQMAVSAYNNVLAHTADIQGGQMVFDYTGDVTPAKAIRASLHSGAMYTSTGAAQGCGVGYSDDGVIAVTAKVALLGDTDMGGTVNNDDLARLLSALGGTDCVWLQGDFNYDSKVNNDDLAMLLSNLGKTFAGFGSAKAQALGGAVPEPSTLVLLTAGLIGLAAYAWRKRK